MSNTLTNLLAPAYAGLDMVSRELVGYIPAVTRNTSVDRAAIGQTVYVPIAPAVTAADSTPAVTAPDTGDNVIGNATVAITKSRHVAIRWSGEETLGTQNSQNFDAIMAGRFEQAFRTLINEIEVDLGTSYKWASRAYGSAGTAPFATAGDLTDAAGVAQILDDNGAPIGERQLVLGSAAIANVRGKQSSLFKVNEAGTDELLRTGLLNIPLEGFALRYSGQVPLHTKGTGINYLSDLVAGYAVGDTTVHVDTGTGTQLAGDVVTFAGDTNKYIVGTGHAGDGDQDVVFNAPGLRATLANDVAATTGANFRANLAFCRSCIILATRLPAMPVNGDAADDRATMTDPRSGLTFEIATYKQFLQNTIHVRIAWGFKPIKPEHMAILLG
jgi:hypothetical protein